MNCKFCGSGNVSSLRKIQSQWADCEYTLFMCNACKNQFFEIKENSVDIEEIYRQYAEKHNKQATVVKFQKSCYWESEVKRSGRIFRKYNNRKILSVLDVGCRTGDFLLHFPADIVREGVELSENSAETAKKRGLSVYQNFVEKIDFKREYDLVTNYAVLEHLQDPLCYLQKIKGIVAKRGLLVIMIPTYECFKRRMNDTFISAPWWMYNPPLHLNLFSRQFLDGYLAGNNFKLVYRYWTSGGMFNPFRKVPFANRVFGKFMHLADNYTPVNKFPFFDHLYSYYVRTI